MNTSNKRESINWLFLGVLWGFSYLSGMYGFSIYSTIHDLNYSFWDILYLTLQLIPLNSGGLEPLVPVPLNIARFLLPMLSALAALKALWFLFHEQIKKAQLLTLKNHIIICGLSQKGYLFAKRFQEAGIPVVIIEKNKDNPWLKSCQNKGMFLLIGDASDFSLLENAGLKRARGLIATTDDDGTNIEIAMQVKNNRRGLVGNTFHCLVHSTDPLLCKLVNDQIIDLGDPSVQIKLFNVYELGARRMLQVYPAWQEVVDQSARILLIGLGRFGQELLVQMARTWWNFRDDHEKKLCVTIVDRNAQENFDILLGRHPQMAEAVEFDIFTMEIESSSFESGKVFAKIRPDIVYICLDNDSQALKTGLAIQRHILHTTPIILRLAQPGGLETLVHTLKKQDHAAIRLEPFLVLDEICKTEILYHQPRDILAKAFHHEYLSLQRQQSITNLEDWAMQSWNQLSDELKNRNYQQVDHLIKLVSIFGFSIKVLEDWDAPSQSLNSDLIEKMAQYEHELWVADRLVEGWHYQTGEKDPKNKTSPALLPWADLSEVERNKNLNFVRNIPIFLGKAGYQLVFTKNEAQGK